MNYNHMQMSATAMLKYTNDGGQVFNNCVAQIMLNSMQRIRYIGFILTKCFKNAGKYTPSKRNPKKDES